MSPKAIKPAFKIELQSPFPEVSYPAMYFWLREFWDKVAADGGPETVKEFVAYQTERAEKAVTWGVYREGELGGYIEYCPISANMGLGHGVFKRAFWGQKTTVPAINMAMLQVWALGVDLVIFTPFDHNSAIKALLKRIGAREMGPIPGRYTQDGKPVDSQILGLVQAEWVKHNPQFVIEHIPVPLLAPEPEAEECQQQ